MRYFSKKSFTMRQVVGLLTIVFFGIGVMSYGGEVTGLINFAANTTIRALEVNNNFAQVKNAVDDNNSRIAALETNAANPNISGNITLVPSTATTGVIMKGTIPFLHNYGTNNTFLGENAGNFTMTGVSNTASGNSALYSNTTGYSNTASGYLALYSNTNGFANTANGEGALQSNTTGVGNTASGYAALNSNTTGSGNTASGRWALYSNTTGFANTASGAGALSNNTTGYYNTASGVAALQANTTGHDNTASGYNALQYNTAGFSNTASGAEALFSNTTGFSNTASGAGALSDNTTGSTNIALGFNAGVNLTTGSHNIVIGNHGVAGESGTIRIGDTQPRAFIAGIRGRTTGVADAISVVIDSAGQLGTVSSSRRVKDDIIDMGKASDVLMQLRPVTFHYKSDQNPQGRTLQYGLIAEEVAEVAPMLVAHSADGKIETVYYQHLTPMLLNEYQKQQRTIAAQSAMLTKQTARITQLEKQAKELADLKAQVARMTAVLSQLQQTERVAAAGR